MGTISEKLVYLNGTKQAIKQAINEDFEVIYDKGKNLFDKDSISNGFLDESGVVGGDTRAYMTSDFIPILPNTAYYKTTTSSPRTKYYDKNKQPLNTTTYWDISIGGNAGTFTTPSNAYYFRFSYPIAGVDANSIQIEKGTTATDYEPYVKETTFREYADEISSNNAKYKDLIPKETKNATNTLDISNSSGLDKTLVTQYGNTYQETTTGKNLFDNVYGQTENVYTKHINAPSPLGSVDCYPINLLPNTQYTLKIDMNGYQKTGAWIAGVCFEDGDVISLLQLNSMADITTTTFITDSTGVVYVGQRYGFTYGTTGRMDLFLQTAKIQLEKGSTATDFEKYTGGNPAPNPDYPQEIVNISGKSNAKVVGKNLCDYDNNTDYSTYYLNNEGNWIEDGSSNYINQKINITSNIISIYIGAKTGGAYIRLGQFKSDGTFITRTLINGSTNNVTLNSNCSYIWLSTNKDSSTYFENVSVIYGNSISAYEPYQEQSFDLDLKSKNLFDKNNFNVLNAYFTANSPTITSSYSDRTIYIACQPNTTYTISKLSSPNARAIGYTSSIPAIGTSVDGALNISANITTGTITTGANAKYLVMRTWNEGQDRDTSFQQILDSIQIEESSTPTEFEPFYDINLCKIGDYKDRIYPLNGKWYLEKKINKVVLNGSENWNYQSEHHRFIMNLSPRPVNGAMCYATTYIKGQTSKAGSNNSISLASGTGYSQLLIHDERFATKNDYNNWLSNNNVEVYYPLETPTTEEITESNYPTLYNQLNNIKLFEGVNHITMTNESGLDVEFDIEYYKDWKLD